jgi:transposase, IS5 family
MNRMEHEEFGSLERRQQKLNQKKDVLVTLNAMIPWESFRELLESVRDKPRKSNAGRKPFDVILLFKLMILQQLYNISDEELEYQVNDRISFMQFLGLSLDDIVPDGTTVWLFRQQLTNSGKVSQLFEQFEHYLRIQGYSAQGGQIVDATLIPVPKQRNKRSENEQIRQGEVPEAWQQNPHKLAQKDVEARWTKKNNVSYFGYKNHISIDATYGFIRRYEITAASVHDSQVIGELLDGSNLGDSFWGDSAYRSALIESVLALMGFESQVNERGFRNHPLTEEQKQTNREKSKVRAKVEHVFGGWVMQMGGKLVRSIGIARAQTHLGLKNLAYNFLRYRFWLLQTAEVV